jgi:hypothetical protein
MLFGKGNRFTRHEEAAKVQHSEACPPISQLSTRGAKIVDDWAQPSISSIDVAAGAAGSPEACLAEQSSADASRLLGRKTIFHIQESGPGVGEYDLQSVQRSRVRGTLMKPPSSKSRVDGTYEAAALGEQHSSSAQYDIAHCNAVTQL